MFLESPWSEEKRREKAWLAREKEFIKRRWKSKRQRQLQYRLLEVRLWQRRLNYYLTAIVRGLNPGSAVANSWARFDDTTTDDPRMIRLAQNLPARLLFYDARIYCARTMSDGKVSDSVTLGLCRGYENVARESVDALVAVGLWRRHPDGDGWEDVDFLKLHRTRAEILAIRAKRQKAGALGGLSTQAKALASALADAEASASEEDEEWQQRVPEEDE
jgi:hypothetical protein